MPKYWNRYAAICSAMVFVIGLMLLSAVIDGTYKWVLAVVLSLGFAGVAYGFAPKSQRAAKEKESLKQSRQAPDSEASMVTGEVRVRYCGVSRQAMHRVLPILETEETDIYWISRRRVTTLFFGVPSRYAVDSVITAQDDSTENPTVKRQKGILLPLTAAVICLVIGFCLAVSYNPASRLDSLGSQGKSLTDKALAQKDHTTTAPKVQLPEVGPGKSQTPVSTPSTDLNPKKLEKLLALVFLLLFPVLMVAVFLRWATWYTWYFVISNANIRVIQHPLAIMPLSSETNDPFQLQLVKGAAYSGSWLQEKLGFSQVSIRTYLDRDEEGPIRHIVGLPKAPILTKLINAITRNNSGAMDEEADTVFAELRDSIRELNRNLQKLAPATDEWPTQET